jgi:DNA (cytosine-5)-methyltransferase 1
MKTLDNLGYAVPQNPIILSPHLLNIPQERNRVFIPGVLREKMKKPSKYIELDFSKYFVPYTQTRKTIEKDYLESNVNPKYFLDLLNKKDNYLVNSLNA